VPPGRLSDHSFTNFSLKSMPKEKPQLQDREFQLLLTTLGDSSERGAHEYLNLHKRITTLFINSQSCAPEELADETLNRLAHQLAEGKEINPGSSFPYAYGIANNIRREHWRSCESCKRRRIRRDDENDGDSLDSLPAIDSLADKEDVDGKGRMLECLDECLAKMNKEERLLLLEYYSEDKTQKIVTRDRMATRLSVTSGALRQRLWKLRTPLRDCTEECAD
jgi:DNA-directed RNA polymerase specialized sigma24 family protein